MVEKLSFIITGVLVTCTLLCVLFLFTTDQSSHESVRRLESIHTHKQDHHKACHPVKYLPGVHLRHDIGYVLKAEGFEVGVELGVQRGGFAKDLLERWEIAESYTYVDIWAQQENYKDGANVDQNDQNTFMNEAVGIANTQIEKHHLKELTVCRNYTIHCAINYPNEHFDFIYVDARHDYKGVLVDLQTWWPKLKRGGIMGGHDYLIQSDLDYLNRNYKGPREDWTVNYDGTKDTTGRVVKGAVDDFFSDLYGDLNGCPRQTVISYREPTIYASWFVRK